MTRFGSFELDAATHRLTHRGQPVHLTPKAFDLLCLLVDEAPRVVSKREIYSRLWPNQVVTDATLLGLVKEVRRAIGDDDPDQRLIRTVHRVGYAFEALLETSMAVAVIDRQRVGRDTATHVRAKTANIPRLLAGLAVLSLAAFGLVRLVSEPPRDLEAIGAAAGPALRPSSAEKTSIAVLPCDDLSEGGGQVYLTDGIANALSNLLTQTPELRVPASHLRVLSWTGASQFQRSPAFSSPTICLSARCASPATSEGLT
jgi:DNA-binding winged helix-turn-helix (wHTH) protein